MTNKDLLYSTGNLLCFVITYKGNKSEKEYIYMYIYICAYIYTYIYILYVLYVYIHKTESLFCTSELTQHYKSTIVQKKKLQIYIYLLERKKSQQNVKTMGNWQDSVRFFLSSDLRFF